MHGQQLLSYLRNNSSIVIHFIGVLVGVLKKKTMDYSCFQYFDRSEYTIYLGTMIELIGILLPYMDVAC